MRLDVVSKAARAAARFSSSARFQSQQFRTAHASAALRAALVVEAGQSQHAMTATGVYCL